MIGRTVTFGYRLGSGSHGVLRPGQDQERVGPLQKPSRRLALSDRRETLKAAGPVSSKGNPQGDWPCLFKALTLLRARIHAAPTWKLATLDLDPGCDPNIHRSDPEIIASTSQQPRSLPLALGLPLLEQDRF